MTQFVIEHWAKLLLAFMAFIKIIVNLTPTEKDNKVFGWIDVLINSVISDRRKGEPFTFRFFLFCKKK